VFFIYSNSFLLDYTRSNSVFTTARHKHVYVIDFMVQNNRHKTLKWRYDNDVVLSFWRRNNVQKRRRRNDVY